MRIPYDPQGPAGRVAVMVRLLWNGWHEVILSGNRKTKNIKRKI